VCVCVCVYVRAIKASMFALFRGGLRAFRALITVRSERQSTAEWTPPSAGSDRRTAAPKSPLRFPVPLI